MSIKRASRRRQATYKRDLVPGKGSGKREDSESESEERLGTASQARDIASASTFLLS